MPVSNRLQHPITYHVNVQQALEALDYIEMIALSQMFERWALNEENIDGSRRTKLIQRSSDYERIAGFCGNGWVASDPGSPPDLMAFIAWLEGHSRGLYRTCRDGSARFNERVPINPVTLGEVD